MQEAEIAEVCLRMPRDVAVCLDSIAEPDRTEFVTGVLEKALRDRQGEPDLILRRRYYMMLDRQSSDTARASAKHCFGLLAALGESDGIKLINAKSADGREWLIRAELSPPSPRVKVVHESGAIISGHWDQATDIITLDQPAAATIHGDTVKVKSLQVRI